jgi:hypothetical protein
MSSEQVPDPSPEPESPVPSAPSAPPRPPKESAEARPSAPNRRPAPRKSKTVAGYQVCVHVGPRPKALDSMASRFVELAPAEATPEAVLASIESSGLEPADFRSEAVVSLDCDRDLAVLVYAALAGFGQRRIDVVVGSRRLDADQLDRLARQVVDAGKPDPLPSQVQVGVVEHAELPTVLFSAQVTPEQASMVRFARRLRFAPSQDTVSAVTQFLVVAGIRARGSTDRFPYLVVGDEPAPPADEPLQVAGVCLDTLRSAALALRRVHRAGTRDAIVEPEPLSSRRQTLLSAAEVPIEDALVILGGRQNAETGLWHCPRPARHTNGDANASMRTMRDKVRCYRCDGERVDSLRLAVDVLGVSPDEAAAWLLERATAKSESELGELFS